MQKNHAPTIHFFHFFLPSFFWAVKTSLGSVAIKNKNSWKVVPPCFLLFYLSSILFWIVFNQAKNHYFVTFFS
jgi:hypothetical protein